MLTKILLVPVILLFGQLACAQHPLTGTWEMVSIAGVNVDGEKFFLDTTTIKETKIITPTHYILIAHDKENGAWVFNRSYVGKTKIEGEKYYEIPLQSSLRIFENVTTDFTWKIEGDLFTQSGTITRPDGKQIIVDKFLFKRIHAPTPAHNSNFIGTWEIKDKKNKGFLIITPTHWMSIVHLEDKFNKAMGGVYSLKGQEADLTILYGSASENRSKLKLDGTSIRFDGLVFEKVPN